MERLIEQYQDSPNVLALFESLIKDKYTSLNDVTEFLYKRLDIDSMFGIHLDEIGKIVGQPRPKSFEGELGGFRFLEIANNPDVGFSGINRTDVGGFWTGIETSPLMNDGNYRLLLKAAIFRNNSGCTIPELKRYAQLVLNMDVNIQNYHTYIEVTFSHPLSIYAKILIEETFKPAAGIRVKLKAFGMGERPFGFVGANNCGFGGVGLPQDGSGFVRLF